MMFKQDFQEVAYSLWAARQNGTLTDAEAIKVVNVITPALKRSNPRFNLDQFLAAVMEPH